MSALGPFPVRFLGSCVVGAGMGGLLPALVNVGVLAADGDPQWSGFWCFLFAEGMAVACLGASETRNYYKYYLFQSFSVGF